MSLSSPPSPADQLLPVAVGAAIVIDNGKILLTKRPEGKKQGGLWEFPGGKLDHGESPHTGLVRELKEELGISIDVGSHFKSVFHRYDWGSALILAYLCRWRGESIQHFEVADHRWVAPSELDNFHILPADQPIIEKLKKYFQKPVGPDGS